MELKVAEAMQNDVGRSIVRIDSKSREALNVKTGDIVELKGKSTTGAIVWRSYSQDEGLGIIRIDPILRNNAGASLGDKVSVKKANVKDAVKLLLTPDLTTDTPASWYNPSFGDFVKRRIVGRPLSGGDRLVVGVLGANLPFTVTSLEPTGIVRVTDLTDLTVKKTSAKTEKAGAPSVAYEDIGGLGPELKKIREMIELPLKHPVLFERLGIEPPKGVLLHGPPGTGKTLIARAVANETKSYFKSLNGPEIMSKFYGESEENLRKMFKEAEENAPAILFIDEIDAIAPKREEVTGEVERRVVAQLLTLMDGLASRGKIVVIGATNRPDAIDPALRRPGRFDRELVVGVPDKGGRKEVLQIHSRGMPLYHWDQDVARSELKDLIQDEVTLNELIEAGSVGKNQLTEKLKELDEKILSEVDEKVETSIQRSVDIFITEIADTTHGFVGADLESVCKEAAMSALRKILPDIDLESDTIPSEVLENLRVIKEDFVEALRTIEPSALREVFIEVSDIGWEDVGGLEEIKRDLREAVEWPIKRPTAFTKMGIKPPKGVLIYGPPGCGKTLIAKAVANESEANFISIKGPELISKWVGESEKAIREIFKKARQAAPTVIFFDEVDAMASMRGQEAGHRTGEKVLNQLLTEMDGLEELHNVFIIAATNRPDLLDPALLRPGRFDKMLLVPVPDKEALLEIFKVHTQGMPLAEDVNLNDLTSQCEGFVGADVEALCREAAMIAIRETLEKESEDIDTKRIEQRHFQDAIKEVSPSVNKDSQSQYESFQRKREAPEGDLNYMG